MHTWVASIVGSCRAGTVRARLRAENAGTGDKYSKDITGMNKYLIFIPCDMRTLRTGSRTVRIVRETVVPDVC